MIKNTTIVTQDIVEALTNQSKEMIISSDGSNFKNKSGGAYLLGTKQGDIIATGYNTNTGEASYQHSYRSESQAKLAGHLCLHHKCKYSIYPYQTPHHHVIIKDYAQNFKKNQRKRGKRHGHNKQN